jgi:putative transcriptional regulator
LITQPVVGGGPLGVIVNRPIAAKLSEIIPGAATVPEHFDQIYGGGPVARNQLLFLIRSSERPERSLQVLPDVYLSGERELLEKIVRGEMTVPAFRAYAGYSGWAPGQLQAELARGGWYVIQADADTVFAADASAIWPQLIKRISTKQALLEREEIRRRLLRPTEWNLCARHLTRFQEEISKSRRETPRHRVAQAPAPAFQWLTPLETVSLTGLIPDAPWQARAPALPCSLILRYL